MTDARIGCATFPFEILRFETDAGEGKDLVFSAELRMTINYNVRMEPAFFAQDYMLSNHAIGANFAIRTNLRADMDNCRGVNHRLKRRPA